ncbi:MAG: hypothetical protein CBARDMAM_6202 [uncultured Caballeronia sp.]|nr:MAG: hypothetical protein CBARDMAM_6202 [uncultured Caballeronia sp.]
MCETVKRGERTRKKKLPEELFKIVWWASRESNTAPTDYAYQLRFSPPLSGLWSGLSLVFTTCPFSLYTFSLRELRSGLPRCQGSREVSPNLSSSTEGQS